MIAGLTSSIASVHASNPLIWKKMWSFVYLCTLESCTMREMMQSCSFFAVLKYPTWVSKWNKEKLYSLTLLFLTYLVRLTFFFCLERSYIFLDVKEMSKDSSKIWEVKIYHAHFFFSHLIMSVKSEFPQRCFLFFVKILIQWLSSQAQSIAEVAPRFSRFWNASQGPPLKILVVDGLWFSFSICKRWLMFDETSNLEFTHLLYIACCITQGTWRQVKAMIKYLERLNICPPQVFNFFIPILLIVWRWMDVIYSYS